MRRYIWLLMRDWLVAFTGLLALPLIFTGDVSLGEGIVAALLSLFATGVLGGARYMREALTALRFGTDRDDSPRETPRHLRPVA